MSTNTPSNPGDRSVSTGIAALFTTLGVPAGVVFLLLSFFIPLWPGVPVVLLWLAVVLISVQAWRRPRGERFSWPGLTSPVFWLLIFYALHVIGLIWSTNLSFGFFDLDSKSPLLFFALLACMLPRIGSAGRNMLFFAFTLGCVVSVILHVLMAVWRAVHGSELAVVQEFYSSQFSTPIHPSYLALYLCTAIAAWYLTPIHRAFSWFGDLGMLIVLCLGIVLCGSKAGWIVLIVLLPLLLMLQWKDLRIRAILATSITVTALAIAGLVLISPNARDRVQEVFRAAQEDRHHADATTSSEMRWLTWSAAWDLFKSAPALGTGTGDVKDELLRIYEERGNSHALELRLNAHDQFLQSAACLGVLGVLSLMATLLLPLLQGRRHGRLAVIVACIWIINLIVESMFEVQAGTIFFGFTLLLLFSGTADEQSERTA